MSATPNPSKLDSSQILQHAFDDTTQTLRVNTEATVVNGSFEIAVDHTNDSVKIGDGYNFAQITDDGALKVSSGLIKEQFDFFSANHTDVTSIYTYKRGGAGGAIVGIVTIIYTDATKREIASLAVS